ncbi:siderophore-interacting protein [Streptomyces sp. CRN 30]|uniref:siderophore-interacting protein n=1 Tax=Streptomyces sp. CRN 30 TaxID=3075613 RepID=UPI002A80027B|nr:siderophore-interacting protein [Streptomyces sp. CRN 30]
MTTAVATPFRIFSLQVARTRRLGPSLVRVTFAGPDLLAFHSDGMDQSLSLFLPRPGQPEPVVPLDYGDSWWQAWCDVPEDVRAVMRSYTLRALRRDADGDVTEIDIDFVLHGVGPGADAPAGPASRWAAAAAPGDRVALIGPAVADNRAIRFRPPEGTDLALIWGDETALPAAAAILESLPPGTRAHVWLEVRHAQDIQDLTTVADAEITWLVRTPGAPTALDLIRETELPDGGQPYAWIAGEAGRVKELRRHLVRERGIDKRCVTFVGYWREGLTEEQLRVRGE